MTAEQILSTFSNYEQIESNGDFDTYVVSVNNNFSILMLTYEYENPTLNYQTEWFNTREEAIKQCENDLNLKINRR